MKYLINSEIGTGPNKPQSKSTPLILSLFALALLARCGQTSLAQSHKNIGEPHLGLINPQAVAFNPGTGKA